MAKKWFELKEQGAGAGRLMLSYRIYEIFGEAPVRIIAFFVVLVVFLKAKDQRESVVKFFRTIKKPAYISAFRLFLNYGNSLVDKFISFSGNFDTEKFVFENESQKQDIKAHIEDSRGIFFLTTHVGNVEILRSLFQSKTFPSPKRVNVFLQSSACETFNSFLKKLETKLNLEVFPVEEISADTSIMISERLKAGEFVFMAGDRVSAQNYNKVYEKEFLGKTIELPLGAVKFAQMMGSEIYFIVCAKESKNYKIHTRKFSTDSSAKADVLKDLQDGYVKFFEEFVMRYPYQFYNFGG